MRFLRFALPVFITCLIVPVRAQETLQRDPHAVQILTQSSLLMGGAQKGAVVDIRVEGTLANPGAPDTPIGTFVASARGHDFAVDMTQQGEVNSYRVINGKGSVKRKDGIKPLRPYQTSGLSLDILPLFARWSEFADAKAQVGRVETITLDGVRCHRVLVTNETTSEDSIRNNEHDKQEVLIDETSGLVAAIRYTATQGPYVQDKVLIENRFSQYRFFGGFLLPSRITRYISGEPRVVLQVGSVRFNAGLTDQDFQNRGER